MTAKYTTAYNPNIRSQVEDDLDTEIENLRRAFEEKLTACREMTLKYKGENGIMKKKYVVMQRDIEDQKVGSVQSYQCRHLLNALNELNRTK